VVGHACGGAARGAAGAGSWCPPSLPSPLGSHTAICRPPRKPWAELLPASPLHTLLTPLEGCPWEAGWGKCQVQVTAPSCPARHWGRCQGPGTWIGHLTPAENLMEKNPEGPDVRFDGVKPSGEGLGGGPLVGDVVVVGKVDILQADTCGWASAAALTPPTPAARTGPGVLVGQCSRALMTATRGRCSFPSDSGGGGGGGGPSWQVRARVSEDPP